MDKYTIELIVGDGSYEGHGRTKVIVIESNLTSQEIKAAYSLGANKSGVDLSTIDNILTAKNARKLMTVGINPDLYHEDIVGFRVHSKKCTTNKYSPCRCLYRHKKSTWDDDRAEVGLYPESFADLYLAFVKLGDPTFEYKEINPKWEDKICIGGYGLFGG